ncbi:uncharacterized protein (TIGR00156 family) [Burkholderia ambifaria]|nr:NirD/YgiW/YdeI family stress tolerance protein [Burkholderia ambifaria]MDR6499021.1 uncharacterized protein (TIGR00156 family) [Burkholderia ambifaria]
MKKIIALLAIALPAFAVHAQYRGPSATNAQRDVRTLMQQGVEDQRVVLRGHILRQLGNERYRFSDGSGEITAEIDHDIWPVGQEIFEDTTVELVGEFDKERFGESKIDVKQLRVVSQGRASKPMGR